MRTEALDITVFGEQDDLQLLPPTQELQTLSESFLMVDSQYLLTGLEVWCHGWHQFFLVCSQATVTSLPERFMYYFFHQIVAEGSVRLSGLGGHDMGMHSRRLRVDALP